MSEDERLKLLETVLEAHTYLADAALELRRRLSAQAPLAKAADKAEQEVFRLKSELQRFDVSDPLAGGRQDQQVLDFVLLRR